MSGPVRSYQGYLSPNVGRITEMHSAGASTHAIAEALYQSGVRADTTNLYTPKMKREHHIRNLRLMVLHVLRRHGLHVSRKHLQRWPKLPDIGHDQVEF